MSRASNPPYGSEAELNRCPSCHHPYAVFLPLSRAVCRTCRSSKRLSWVEVWTDGSITGNGRPDSVGGWAYIIRMIENCRCTFERVLTGSGHGVTVNEMELMPVFMALSRLEKVSKTHRINVFSDSEYVTKAFQGRTDQYAADGWKSRPNVDLLRLIHDINEPLSARFFHVDGHTGIEQNERADTLAKAAKMEEIARDQKTMESSD